MQYLKTAGAIGDQIHDQAHGNLVNNGGRVLTNASSNCHGTSHICKDKWRTRANQKDLVVSRKVHF
jgi:hypothetical protein